MQGFDFLFACAGILAPVFIVIGGIAVVVGILTGGVPPALGILTLAAIVGLFVRARQLPRHAIEAMDYRRHLLLLQGAALVLVVVSLVVWVAQ